MKSKQYLLMIMDGVGLNDEEKEMLLNLQIHQI